MQRTWMRRGRGVFLASAALVVSCGDGSGPSEPPGGDNGNPPGTAVTVEERLFAIGTGETLLEALLASDVEGDALNEALAMGLKGLPMIEATGVDTTTSMAWARFTDGRLLIIGNNRPPGPVPDSVLAAPAMKATAATRSSRTKSPRGDVASEATRPSAAPTGIAADGDVSELPSSPHVRLLHSFGADFDQLQQPIEDMAKWFEEHGYEVRAGQEGDASLATLRTISGDGFFYFNTHGGGGLDMEGRKLFSMTSSTLVSEANDQRPEILDDLNNNRLVYFTAPNGEYRNGKPVSDTRYAITRFFVEKYWSFAENSIVFLNVCFSAYNDPDIVAFISEMHDAGAGLYLGWSGSVTPTGGFRAVRYFVDRLLGANEFQPESPKQRPFTWPLVMEDMASKGYTRDGAAQLAALPARSGPGVGILRPSIRSVYMAPEFLGSDLYIEGHFGTRPDRVTIDDGGGPVEVAIKEWSSTGIITAPPLTGAGSIGDVVVHVGEHSSNPRRLHRFTGTAYYRLTDAGSLTQSVEMELNTRLDVDEMRYLPGETPWRPQTWGTGSGSPAAGATYEASGSYTRVTGDCTETVTWSGGASVPHGVHDTEVYAQGLWIDGSSRLTLLISFNAEANRQSRLVCEDGSSTRNSALYIGIDAELQGDEWFPLQTTSQMHGIGQSHTVQVRSNVGAGQATARLWWTDIVPTPAYDPDQAK